MTTALESIRTLLPHLSSSEKARLLRWIAQDLAADDAGIERSTDVCGGDARVLRTRIPVWTLEQARRLGLSAETVLASYPSLCIDDIENAWRYARVHSDEINRAIAENEA